MRRLAPVPAHRRIVGALGAAAISGLLIAGLGGRGVVGDERRDAMAGPFVTVYLQPPAQSARSVAADRAARPAPRPERPSPGASHQLPASAAALRRSQPITVPPPRPAPPPPPIANDTATMQLVDAPTAASAPVSAVPLRVDAGTLRAAAGASRSSVAAMARAGGRDLDLSIKGHASADSAWQRAVGAAGRADCLAADEHASLLSAVSIAARALSGRCP